jgi:hypothetical protein
MCPGWDKGLLRDTTAMFGTTAHLHNMPKAMSLSSCQDKYDLLVIIIAAIILKLELSLRLFLREKEEKIINNKRNKKKTQQ